VPNLDVFFQNMYRYYQNKGFSSIVAAGVTNLVSMAFTVALSTWLFALVDWHKLTTCNDEDSCQTFDYYVTWEVRADGSDCLPGGPRIISRRMGT
jgi:hypothetical protein